MDVPVRQTVTGCSFDWNVVYVTNIEFTISPFPRSFPEPETLPLTVIESFEIGCASGIITFLDFLSLVDGIEADWETFEHDEESRRGHVEIHLGRGSNPRRVSTMSWSYEPLDDPDNAEPLTIPVDFHTEVIGAITPEQEDHFWRQVHESLDPFDVLDAFLQQHGLVPRFHDSADRTVIRKVLALEWFRNFPTLHAGEMTLDSGVNLTDAVLGQLALMANRCALEGPDYDLFEIFVETAS